MPFFRVGARPVYCAAMLLVGHVPCCCCPLPAPSVGVSPRDAPRELVFPSPKYPIVCLRAPLGRRFRSLWLADYPPEVSHTPALSAGFSLTAYSWAVA